MNRKWTTAVSVLVLGWSVVDAQAFYNPNTGRWLNRDPIGERGGPNLYGFVSNDPIDALDSDGREEIRLPNNRNDFPRPKYDELTRQCGIPQNENRRRLLDYGCIGVCMAAQGQDANNTRWPEQFGDTKCYLAESKARQRACPSCVRKVLFSKQGRFKDGKAPTEGADGTVPNDSVSANTDGTFNYVTIGQLRQQEWYIWADHGVFPNNPNMTVTVSKTPCDDAHYRDKIWCTTCIK